MLFPIFIFKDKDTDYGVVVPGLPGCFSAGGTAEEAMTNAKEAIELHLEGMVEDGLDVPEQKGIDSYKKELKAGGVAALVEVDVTPFIASQSERVNVTFPKPLLTKIDKTSEELGMTRSGFLQKAAKDLIATAAPAKAKHSARVRESRSPYKKSN